MTDRKELAERIKRILIEKLKPTTDSVVWRGIDAASIDDAAETIAAELRPHIGDDADELRDAMERSGR